jgi:hypothetical protein
MAKPKSDRHSQGRRTLRAKADEFAAQDAAAEAVGLSWTEWAREVLGRAAKRAKPST